MSVAVRLKIPTIRKAPKGFNAVTTEIDLQHEAEIVESIWRTLGGCSDVLAAINCGQLVFWRKKGETK